MYPHRIRLRGPWEAEPLHHRDSSAELPAPRTMTIPCRWSEAGLAGFAGRILFRRRFGYPGQIDADERVWLTGAGIAGLARISLNAQPLGLSDGPFAFEITALLKPRNELLIDIDGDEQGGLYGEVALEIRRTAFLRGITVKPQEDRRILIEGEAVGEADGELELYVVVGRRHAGYLRIEPRPEGNRFQIRTEPLKEMPEPEDAYVRVDLIRGAEIWYREEQPLGV